MSQLHVCNSFFEFELERPREADLIAWMRSHPAILQLQFLPLLYAAPKDLIAVSDLPEMPHASLCRIEEIPRAEPIESWGASLAVAKWAETQKIPYLIPDWEIVKAVNSKIFSFLESPQLPGSALLRTTEETRAWIERMQEAKVLKTAFGTAGKGHFHPGKSRNLAAFLERQFEQQLPVIGEPWVERVFDFSTQWKNGKLLGATAFENEPNGTYLATLAGPIDLVFKTYKWALEEHLKCARPLIEKIQKMGFFGNLGIDAYVYRQNGKLHLQPVVEINGRKTMSWAALQIQQAKFPDRTLRFSYSRSKTGLLPNSLIVDGKIVRFSRNVEIRWI